MAVALDDPGDGQGAAEVDDLGAVADEAVEALRLGAEGGDAVAPDGDPRGRGDAVVDGDDLAVHEHEVGGLLHLPLAAVDDEKDGDKGDEEDDESQAAVSRGHGAAPFGTGVAESIKIYRPPRQVNSLLGSDLSILIKMNEMLQIGLFPSV